MSLEDQIIEILPDYSRARVTEIITDLNLRGRTLEAALNYFLVHCPSRELVNPVRFEPLPVKPELNLNVNGNGNNNENENENDNDNDMDDGDDKDLSITRLIPAPPLRRDDSPLEGTADTEGQLILERKESELLEGVEDDEPLDVNDIPAPQNWDKWLQFPHSSVKDSRLNAAQNLNVGHNPRRVATHPEPLYPPGVGFDADEPTAREKQLAQREASQKRADFSRILKERLKEYVCVVLSREEMQVKKLRSLIRELRHEVGGKNTDIERIIANHALEVEELKDLNEKGISGNSFKYWKAKVKEKDTRVWQLESENARLKDGSQLKELRDRVASLQDELFKEKTSSEKMTIQRDADQDSLKAARLALDREQNIADQQMLQQQRNFDEEKLKFLSIANSTNTTLSIKLEKARARTPSDISPYNQLLSPRAGALLKSPGGSFFAEEAASNNNTLGKRDFEIVYSKFSSLKRELDSLRRLAKGHKNSLRNIQHEWEGQLLAQIPFLIEKAAIKGNAVSLLGESEAHMNVISQMDTQLKSVVYERDSLLSELMDLKRSSDEQGHDFTQLKKQEHELATEHKVLQDQVRRLKDQLASSTMQFRKYQFDKDEEEETERVAIANFRQRIVALEEQVLALQKILTTKREVNHSVKFFLRKLESHVEKNFRDFDDLPTFPAGEPDEENYQARSEWVDDTARLRNMIKHCLERAEHHREATLTATAEAKGALQHRRSAETKLAHLSIFHKREIERIKSALASPPNGPQRRRKGGRIPKGAGSFPPKREG